MHHTSDATRQAVSQDVKDPTTVWSRSRCRTAHQVRTHAHLDGSTSPATPRTKVEMGWLASHAHGAVSAWKPPHGTAEIAVKSICVGAHRKCRLLVSVAVARRPCGSDVHLKETDIALEASRRADPKPCEGRPRTVKAKARWQSSENALRTGTQQRPAGSAWITRNCWYWGRPSVMQEAGADDGDGSVA